MAPPLGPRANAQLAAKLTYRLIEPGGEGVGGSRSLAGLYYPLGLRFGLRIEGVVWELQVLPRVRVAVTSEARSLPNFAHLFDVVAAVFGGLGGDAEDADRAALRVVAAARPLLFRQVFQLVGQAANEGAHGD